MARSVALCAAITAGLGCEEETTDAAAAAAVSVASASRPAEPKEVRPSGCSASKNGPAELATVHGDVHGFDQDATHLYFSSWSVYGGRGDIGKIRKDGEGKRALTSLQLEPRALALTADAIFYTSGIRLMKVPKAGGESDMVREIFSSKDVAIFGEHIYGVPGDYGPYDRVAKMPLKGAEPKEIAKGTRRKREVGPTGYARVVANDSGVYVTDASKDRVVVYTHDGGQPKVLASGQDRPYELAVVEDSVYFNLARKGQLMTVPTSGGKVEKLGQGLVVDAELAADRTAVYTVIAGKDDMSPTTLVRVLVGDGSVAPVGTVPALETVSAITVDEDCVYWTVRKDASETKVFARGI